MNPLINYLSNWDGVAILGTIVALIGSWANLIQIGIFKPINPKTMNKLLSSRFFMILLLLVGCFCAYMFFVPPNYESRIIAFIANAFFVIIGIAALFFSSGFWFARKMGLK
jgi:hypothetical protein